MNFIKKIFGIKSNAPISVESGDLSNPTAEDINEQLFVDQLAPAELQNDCYVKSNQVAQFLDKEYSVEGYNDGYIYHSADIMHSKIKTLNSEFRNLTDKQIEVIRKEILSMKEHRIEIEGLSGRMVKRLDLSIEGLVQTITQLEAEKENSAAEDGLVMKVINEYRAGFIRGMEDYQYEKLLGGNTGMFN